MASSPELTPWYLEEDEDDRANCKDDGVADEGLSGEATDWPGFTDLVDDECKSKSLDSSG